MALEQDHLGARLIQRWEQNEKHAVLPGAFLVELHSTFLAAPVPAAAEHLGLLKMGAVWIQSQLKDIERY